VGAKAGRRTPFDSALRVRHGGRYPQSRSSEFNNLTQNVHVRNHAADTHTQFHTQGEPDDQYARKMKMFVSWGTQSET
jgi:hypothetical protein